MQAEETPRPPAERECLDLEISIKIVQAIKKLQANSLFFEFVYSLKSKWMSTSRHPFLQIYSFSNWMISGVFCFWIPDFCNFTAVPSGKLVNIIGVTVDGAFRLMKSKSISKRGVPFVNL